MYNENLQFCNVLNIIRRWIHSKQIYSDYSIKIFLGELTSFQHYWNVLPCTIGANVNVSGNNTHIEHLQINKAFKRED
jgi:hypothetical protein